MPGQQIINWRKPSAKSSPQLQNGISGQIIARMPPVKNARAYAARIHNGDNVWHTGGLFTGARDMHLTGLTPDDVYTIQIRAIGGSTGYSGWSDPLQRMAI